MRRFMKSFLICAACLAVLVLGRTPSAFGQPRERRGPSGEQSAEAPKAEESKSEKKADDEKAGDSEKKGDDKDKPTPEADKPKRPETVKRPTEPSEPADRRELNVGPDENGLISFSFKGQPWPAVLEWLADISEMSLQWEEAPAGYLDLTTRGRYTIEEVHDLINSVLLSKGFTLLHNGDVLIVANLRNLDTSLVPRVTIPELKRCGAYELVKTFIDLDWLVAADAAEEIKPMLSPYGKVAALKTTNRLDVLETAGNLRRIVELVDEEQSDNGQQRLVEEFRLQHTRAAEVLETLQTLLGIEPKNKAPLDPRQAMMQQQQMMMAQQGQPGQPGVQPAPAKKEPQVFLVVNSRENSILANAPPDKMAVIRQAVAVVDVPQDAGQGLLANIHKMQVYRLAGVTPEALVKVLKELGSLDPTTRLEIDQKNRAIIAYAPLADHVLIRSLVDKLDGAGRRFEVIQLRVLSAEYVAGSINTLMNGPEKTDNSRSRYPFYFFDRGGDSQQQQDPADRFQIEADIEHNRLLLRANDVELAEVKTLLMKLGEVSPEGRNGHTTRVIPAMPGEETQRLLERLERIWPSVAPNPLEIEPGSLEPDASGPPRGRQPEKRSRRPASKTQPKAEPAAPREHPTPEKETRRESFENPKLLAQGPRYLLAQDRQVKQAEDAASGDETSGEVVSADDQPDAPAKPAEVEPAEMDDEQKAPPDGAAPLVPGQDLPRAAHAPVKVTVGPYGLIISSADTDALDRLEDLVVDVMPPRLTYKVFALRHTYAKDVVDLLESIYKNDADGKSKRTDVFESLWYGYRPQSNEKTRSSLSSRRPLSFVPDAVTNTILVQGADANQLAEIESLIEVYDQRETPDSNSVRRTQLVALRYAKAIEVSEIVKDVYRDLLSPNDKALQKNVPQQPQQQQERNGGFYDAMFSYLTDDPEKSQSVPRFKGMLSVGIDERSNSLAISAPQVLLADVLEMVDKLDLAAKPTRAVVRIKKLSRPGSVAQIQQAFGGQKTEPKPAASENSENANNGAENQQPGGMGGRRRGNSQQQN
ncbi:MAG TPA: secretin N-terminal domain-containing protein [Pirellulales bacterium]|nr:secretin N-terminal domain-containing protein [Pirellulales bacterium]